MSGAHIIKVEEAYRGWSKLLIASVGLADGRIARREIEDHGHAACVLPYDPARRNALLIRQWRATVLHAGQAQDILEVIAGLIEDEAPETCVRREAMEEAGLRLDALEHVVTAWSMPGISTERMALFLAEYEAADRVGAGGGLATEHEDIEVVELPLADLARMADAGELTDMKTMVLVQTLRLRKPDLFADLTPA
jgi:nudix-type nucleoside diphosphatase (YffH/AdpP family)